MASRAKHSGRGRVRIVAGRWRGRLLTLADEAELRPTPDRVRETLFNWLTPVIVDSTVLDLYAGSGILGLEALSRGAGHATFVERNSRLCAGLANNISLLGAAEHTAALRQSVEVYLKNQARRFDIVFADPPYADADHAGLCTLLGERGFLADGAHIYLESAARTAPVQLPPGFSRVKEKTAGQVRFELAIYNSI